MAELRQLADKVGVGYTNLSEDEIRQRLRFEGIPYES